MEIIIFLTQRNVFHISFQQIFAKVFLKIVDKLYCKSIISIPDKEGNFLEKYKMCTVRNITLFVRTKEILWYCPLKINFLQYNILMAYMEENTYGNIFAKRSERYGNDSKTVCNHGSERYMVTVPLGWAKAGAIKFDDSWPRELISSLLNKAYKISFFIKW